jgi:serine/threonine protein kinase
MHSALGGINNDALAGIMGEIELLRGLNHPNIVKYIGSFKTRSHLYIIMEVGLPTLHSNEIDNTLQVLRQLVAHPC